jgi:putative nucleotidyltransferase with HDIG domain
VDYAIAGSSAFEFAQRMAGMLGGHFVALDKINDTARIVMPDGQGFDFAGCLGGNIEQDILRRDFTINALYLDPKQPENIIDLVGGIDDIKGGVIRALEESVLISDPLRVLRAFRFAATLGFNIEQQTYAWIKNNIQGLKQVAGERISTELFLAFGCYPTSAVVNMLAETGLLEAIFPELKETRRVTNNAYHHLNLFDHSVEAVVQVENEIIAHKNIWLDTNLFEHMSPGINHLAVCKIASLLHDIGKPSTWNITDEGKHTFIGHENIGAQMVPAIAHRLRWSNAVENLVNMLIALHLRPGQLFHHTQASAKGINRLYRRAGKDFPALILLAFGDLAATQGPQMTLDKSEFLRQKFYSLLNGYYEYSRVAQSLTKLLDGNDIMQLLNLAPGKELGSILSALQEAQELKEVITRQEAEDFVQALHKQNK